MFSPTHSGVIVFVFSVATLLVLTIWERSRASQAHSIHSGSISSMTAAANETQEFDTDHQRSVELGVRIVLSLVVLAAALFVILSKRYDGDQQQWAFGAIGTILGYWLKT